MDQFNKMETAKTRAITENTWYQWYDWVINPIPKSVKKSESNTKQKVMRFVESKIDKNKTMDYKLKKLQMLNTSGKRMKNYQ